MHYIGLLSTLALVGSNLAAPVPDPKLIVVTEWKTIYVTAGVDLGVGIGGGKPTSTRAVVTSTKPASSAKPTSIKTPEATTTAKPITVRPSSVKPSSVKPSSAKPTTQQPTTAKPVTVQPTTAKPTTAKPTTAAPASSAPASSSPAYMDIVNKWRGNMKLPVLAFNATLQANALKTATDGNGKMVHELNPGSFGQVLAPGGANDFEKVFVGGWLCEVPSTPGLNGICTTLSQGWAYNGQTGHNAILVSTKYTKIGCALATGIWACDVGY